MHQVVIPSARARLTTWASAIVVGALAATGLASSAPEASATTTAAKSVPGPALTIGTSADFPPLSFKSNSGTIVGFENDMLNSIMPTTGHRFKWAQLDFNGLLPALQSGRLSAVVSGVYDTAAREKVVSFVDYMQIPLAVLTLKHNAPKVTGAMGLCGHAVADIIGSPPETDQLLTWSSECKAKGKGPITPQGYQTVSEAVTSVVDGRAYAELEGDIVVLYISKSEFGNRLASAFDVVGGTSKVGIVLPKHSPLLPKLRTVVKAWVHSSAYCTDAAKWDLTPGDLLRACK